MPKDGLAEVADSKRCAAVRAQFGAIKDSGQFEVLE